MRLVGRAGPAIVSGATALTLWLVVHNLDRSPARFMVPITYEHPDDIVSLPERVSEVEVHVRATKAKLRTLGPAEFVVRVGNPARSVGRQVVVLDASDVESPFSVVVERVVPAQFAVTYDRRASRVVPVRPEIIGRPADGHEILRDQIAVMPPEVAISGPVSLLSDRIEVRTESIDVSGQNETLRASHVTLVSPGASITIERPATVQVVVPIAPVLARRTFESVAITVRTGAHSTSLPNPKTLRVVIEGPQQAVSKLDARDVRAEVDASDLRPRGSDYKLEPEVSINPTACPGCRVVGKSHSRVNLAVRSTRRSS